MCPRPHVPKASRRGSWEALPGWLGVQMDRGTGGLGFCLPGGWGKLSPITCLCMERPPGPRCLSSPGQGAKEAGDRSARSLLPPSKATEWL